MWVPELLLPLKMIRMFGLKTAIFAPKYAFLGTYSPCRLIWCPFGWLVGGCGARAVSRKTPIYFILVIVVIVVIVVTVVVHENKVIMILPDHFLCYIP